MYFLFFIRPECQAQVTGFPKPVFKKFADEEEAQQFVEGFLINFISSASIIQVFSLNTLLDLDVNLVPLHLGCIPESGFSENS